LPPLVVFSQADRVITSRDAQSAACRPSFCVLFLFLLPVVLFPLLVSPLLSAGRAVRWAVEAVMLGWIGMMPKSKMGARVGGGEKGSVDWIGNGCQEMEENHEAHAT
ncbi:unnamed protein product, partial [Scytosiphon promiscuus]